MKNCVTDRRTEGQTHTQRWNSIHSSPMEWGYKKPKQNTTLMVNHSIFLWLNDCYLNSEQLSLKFSLVLNKKGWKEFFLNGANQQKVCAIALYFLSMTQRNLNGTVLQCYKLLPWDLCRPCLLLPYMQMLESACHSSVERVYIHES